MIADTARSRAAPPESAQKQRIRCMLDIDVYEYFKALEEDMHQIYLAQNFLE